MDKLVATAVKTPRHLYSLDIVRGIAALTVVFWHWQHFFFNGTSSGHIDKTTQPLYSLFFVFYERGWLAVEFFFALSGFIFYWLYFERVHHREISAWNFAILRFSRLYPLHFLTLLIVLVGQLIVRRQTGSYFVYPFNDLYHFVLNLFFASMWGFQENFSFNAPVWSVSIEILLYALFFTVSRYLPARILIALLFVIWGYTIESAAYFRIGRGMFAFFIGGIAYLIYAKMVERQTVRVWRKPLLAMSVVGWLTAVLDLKYRFTGPISLKFWQFVFAFAGPDYIQQVVEKMQNRFAPSILFPLTIITLAVIETQRGSLGKRISFIGNLSYSSYLIHFPLQLLIMIAIGYAGVDTSIFYSKTALLLFFVVLITLSLMSYRFVEMPAQTFLRKQLLTRKPGT